MLASAAGTSLSEAYTALVRGSIFDWQATTTARMWRPMTETLTVATPLILAGLGIFRPTASYAAASWVAIEASRRRL